MTYNTRFVYSKRKSSITAPAPLTTKLISKQARFNATERVLVTLIAEADRVLCQLVMSLTAFFYWVYKKWNSAAIKSLLLFVASFFKGFLVEKYVACQSRKSFFYWVYKKWNSAAIKSLLLFVASLFNGFFWLRNTSLVKVGNPIWDRIVFVFHLAWCVTGLKSLKRFCPCLIASRGCILNGKPE